MADFVATIGLDTLQFQRRMRELKAQAQGDSAAISRSIGQIGRTVGDLAKGFVTFEVLRRLMRANIEATKAYAGQSDAARRQQDQLTASVERFNIALGRGMTGAVGGARNMLAGLIDDLTSVYEGTVDVVANFMALDGGQTVRAVNAANAAEERATRQGRSAEDLRTARRQAEAEEARARGDTLGAERIAIDDEARAERRRIQEEANQQILRAGGDAERVGEITAQRDALLEQVERRRRARTAQAVQAARQRSDPAREAAIADAERRGERFATALDIAAERRRLEGDEVGAARDRITAQFEPRIERARAEGDDRAAANLQRERDQRIALAEQEIGSRRESDIAAFMGNVRGDLQQGQVDRLRLEGRREEADLLALQLETARQIAAVNEHDLLTQQQKADLVAAINADAEATAEAIRDAAARDAAIAARQRAASQDFRVLAGGFGGRLGSQVFGPALQRGGVLQADGREQTMELRKANGHLEKISRSLEEGVVAVAG